MRYSCACPLPSSSLTAIPVSSRMAILANAPGGREKLTHKQSNACGLCRSGDLCFNPVKNDLVGSV